MNKPLSERMLELITVYTTKVTSMEETAQNCIHYNFIISELYTKMNFIKRLELQDKTTQQDYHQMSKFIDLLEIETHKILQEELLIKQLTAEVNKPLGEESIFSQSENNLIAYQHPKNPESHNEAILHQENLDIEENIDDSHDSSKPLLSSEKIIFETSSHDFIEVDISMSDIIKGGTIISDSEINIHIQDSLSNKNDKSKTSTKKTSKSSKNKSLDLHNENNQFEEQSPVDKKNKISKNNKKEEND